MIRQARIAAAAHRRILGDSSAVSVIDNLDRRLEALAAGAGLKPSSILPPAMDGMLRDEAASLRQWLGRVRADAQDAMLALPGQAAANVAVAGVTGYGGKRMALIELDGEPAAAFAGRAGPGLRAVLVALLASESGLQGSFVVRGEQVLARWAEAGVSGKLYAKIAPTERGGAVRLVYRNVAGVSALVAKLAALGFAVEARGDSLSAVMDAETARLGVSGLEETLSRAVGILQEGQDPGRGELRGFRLGAQSEVAKMIAYIQDHRAQSVEAAGLIQSLMPADMHFETIGRVGDYLEVRGRMRLEDGAALVVYALRDPGTGIISHARAELDRSGTPLSLPQLRRILLHG
jgi:hypothetical protein